MLWNLVRPFFILATVPSVALAQTQLPAKDGRAGAPGASGSAYQSAFADYKASTEPVVVSWQKANDQVRDAGGIQGHDMVTMKSSSEDPHAGHDMLRMGASPASPAGPGGASFAEKAGASHTGHDAKKTQAEGPHAGHDMSTMTPAKAATPTPVKPRMPSAAKKSGANSGAIDAQSADPHAGHDLSKMSTPSRQDVAGTSIRQAPSRTNGKAGT